jgi:hypothetical protein
MAPGVRKTDRVARFQKMQQAWQKDRWAAGSCLLRLDSWYALAAHAVAYSAAVQAY